MLCLVCVGGPSSSQVQRRTSVQLQTLRKLPRHFRPHLSTGRQRRSETISVSVLCRGDEGGFVPLHMSKERDRPHHANLLLIEGEDENRHYVLIKNLSRLVRGRTKHRGQTFVCNHCLHPFGNKDTLGRHIPHCQRHAPQDVITRSRKPQRMYFRISQQSGSISSTVLFSLLF